MKQTQSPAADSPQRKTSAVFESTEPLAATRHGHLRLRSTADFRFAAQVHQVPIVASEITEVAKHFTVVFPRTTPTRPVALLGTRTAENCFVASDGRWLAPYVPAYLRRYPFTLGRSQGEGDDRWTVMLDPDAHHFSDTEGEALFDGNGKPSATLQRALSFVSQFQREADAVPATFQPLVDHDVLVERTLDIRRGEQVERRIAGLCVVDRTRLQDLDDATLSAWARTGLLEAVYAHLASLNNLRRLRVAPEV